MKIIRSAALGFLVPFFVGLSPVFGNEQTPASPETSLNLAIRDFILKNPILIREALANAELAEQLERTKQVLRNESDALYRGGPPTIGAADAKVSIVMFYDYNCSFCRTSHLLLAPFLAANSDVQIVLKDIANYGKDSAAISKIVIASRKQNKFLIFHEALMRRQGAISELIAIDIARKIGIDVDLARRDAALPETARHLASTRGLASRLNVEGTPLFVVGHNGIAGAPDDLIDQLSKHVADIRKSGCSVC